MNKPKSRHVVKGYAQIFGVYHFDTIVAVDRHDTIRLLHDLDAQLGWKMYQKDVKSAFLNGFLQEQICIKKLESFVKKGKEDKFIG